MRATFFFGLIIALLFALAVVVAAKYTGFFDQTPPTVRKEPPLKILVAKTNLFEGTAVTTKEVEVRNATEAEKLDYQRHPEKYLPPTPSAAHMRILARSVPANTPLLVDHFTDLALPEKISGRLNEGMVAVNVSVPPERSGGGLLQLGEHVDVLLTTQICADGNCVEPYVATAPIAHNLRIIIKRNMLWTVMLPPAKEGELIHFTLEANPYRAALIEFAKTRGTLTLVPTTMRKGIVPAKGTFSILDSKEYKDEDQRVAMIRQGELVVGDADLARIFSLKPLPPAEPTIRVERYTGVNLAGSTVFDGRGNFRNISATGTAGTFMTDGRQNGKKSEGSLSVNPTGYGGPTGYTFRAPDTAVGPRSGG